MRPCTAAPGSPARLFASRPRPQARKHVGKLIYGVRACSMHFSAAVDQSEHNDKPEEAKARDEAFVLLTTFIHVRCH